MLKIYKLKEKLFCIALLQLFLAYSLFSNNKPILMVMAIMALITYVIIANKQSTKIHKDETPLFFAAAAQLLVLAFGQTVWISNVHSILLVMPIFVLFLVKAADQNILKKSLFAATLIIVAIAAYEKFSGSYFFISADTIDGEELLLDEKLFSGSTGLLRAKSIFFGPLTLSVFMIFTSMVLRKNKYALGLCMLGAIFSTSRSAIFLTFTIAAASYCFDRNSKRNLTILFFATPIAAFVMMFFTTDGAFFSRLFQVFDFNASASNNIRLFFWSMGFKEIADYSFWNFIIGNNGYYKSKYLNNAESGWLTILLDFGLIGLTLYILPLLYVFKTKRSAEIRLLLSLLFVANSVFTFSYGVVGCFGYWLVVYTLLKEEIKIENRNCS